METNHTPESSKQEAEKALKSWWSYDDYNTVNFNATAMMDFADEYLTSYKETLRMDIEKRIAELKTADAGFCADRWDETKSPIIRALAREESNTVTRARQELEMIVLSLIDPKP